MAQRPRKQETMPATNATRFIGFSGASYDEATRTASIVIATSTPVSRYGMVEILAISNEAIDLSRVALGQVKLLDSHNSGSIETILGRLTEAHIEDGQLIGTITFAETDDALEAAQAVARGEITGISAGYKILKWELAGRDEDTDIETWVAARWELFEVSLVSVPADKYSGVRSLTFPITRETVHMETQKTEPAAIDQAAIQEASRLALTNERTRSSEIIAIAARHGLTQDLSAKYIADGTSVEAFKDVVLEHLASQSPAARVASGSGARIEIIDPGQSPAKLREVMVDAIALRYMTPKTAALPVENEHQAREYSSLSILHMGAELAGIPQYHRKSPDAVLEMLSQRSMMGTTDFPLLLSALANKFLLAQYTLQTPSYRLFSVQKPFTNFKAHNFIRAGDFPMPRLLTETGEVPFGNVTENQEQITAKTYAIALPISRQMLVNDDLQAFTDSASAAGYVCPAFENQVAWSIILQNGGAGPLMSDAGNLWNTTATTTAGGHANAASAGTAVTVASLTAGRQAMRNQKSLAGYPLQLVPKYIVSGAAKQTEIDQMLSTNLLANQISNVNVFNTGNTRLTSITDATITDNSWYLFCDPAAAPVFGWGYVGGNNGPAFSVDKPFNRDGLSLKVTEDFAFGALDWRGTWRNAGA
jgi:HK97 family phage prohead protease